MSKKSRDASTLFELIAQTGGRIRGATPADRQAGPPSDESATETAVPSPPGPPPLLEQQPPGPPPEQAPEEPIDAAPAAPAKPPEPEPEVDAKTPPAAAPAAKPLAKAKKKQKKAIRKRAAKTKAAVKVPAKAGKKTADEGRRPPASARAKAKGPADVKSKSAPPSRAAEKLAGKEAAAGAVPPGSAPPAHLQPKRPKLLIPAEGRSAVAVPFSQFAPFVGLAVTVVLMIAVFIVGFIAGRFTAPRPRAPQEQRLVVVDDGSPGESQLDGGLPTGTRVEGMHYLIIQELKGSSPEDLRDAWDIRNFCEEYDYPADVRTYTRPSGREVYIVLSFQPFESPVGDEAKAFVEGVEQLGRTYEEQGGRYRFQQRLTPTGPLQPHFVTWQLPPAQN